MNLISDIETNQISSITLDSVLNEEDYYEDEEYYEDEYEKINDSQYVEELLNEHRSGSYSIICIISDEIKKDISGKCTLYELNKIATAEIYDFICDNINLMDDVKYDNGNIKVDCEDGITCEKIEKLYELICSKNSIGLPWDVSWFNGYDWDQMNISYDNIYKLFLENK